MCSQMCEVILASVILTKLVRICCNLNQLSLINTWLKMKTNLYGTWTHTAINQCNMIDFVLLRPPQRRHCLDVHVMRAATCWMDHKLVRVKLRLVCVVLMAEVTGGLLLLMYRDLLIHLYNNNFVVKCLECLEKMGPISTLETMGRICEHLVSVATAMAGCRRQSPLDWFIESGHLLSLLLSA